MLQDGRPVQKYTIAVDFDGVIHGHSKGWHDGTIYDPPVPGVAEALTKLRERFRVVVYSCRSYDRLFDGVLEPNQVSQMTEYMNKHGIPFDEIYVGHGKPVAYLYIDDRAVQFNGDWRATLRDVDSFQLWNI